MICPQIFPSIFLLKLFFLLLISDPSLAALVWNTLNGDFVPGIFRGTLNCNKLHLKYNPSMHQGRYLLSGAAVIRVLMWSRCSSWFLGDLLISVAHSSL